MIPSPTVIAVDDDAEELASIVAALRALDVACLPVQVGGAKPNLAAPLKGVRLVFFDINYLSSVVSETAMYETAATVMTGVLAPDNGPYMLITWSSKSDKHDALMQYFAIMVPEIPAPAATGYLQKELFTPDGVAADGGQSLRDAIVSVLADRPQVKALMTWERAARHAAGDVLCSLFDLYSREDRFGGKLDAHLHDLLHEIAGKAVGFGNVAADRRGAIDEALVPVLFDRLIHRVPDAEEDAAWASAIPLAQGVKVASTGHGARLNALSYVAKPGSGIMEAGDRGVVFQTQVDPAELLSTRSGLEPAVLAADFLTMKIAKAEGLAPLDMEALAASCRWVFVGVRAICDQAQNKGKLRPVVLALEVPAAWKDRGDGFRHQNHGAISKTPTYTVQSKGQAEPDRCRLLIDWHWTISLGEAELVGSTVLHRIREPLMSQIASEMSGYVARPGIIDFD